ncbi:MULTISPECIES: TetR/AcrR family transcriptional regulator [unclassified Nocardioides]|uniref:TetR/AcrR family transcriptional regulator n=1 Tax=unclassified Nocardioides TaxID=2615069 RepID=UPI0009F09D3A|nr:MULTISPECIES: TetR family transcriptional regulator [unclassified Nocardioides]GAW52280.1 regulatory protein TetR [Nocardioides sp. PD653-B2]GAW56035.1 regulatory protein TetR [Nocardioides sp. PD653]
MPARETAAATVEAPALSPRRRQLLDAALHVIADHGLRGLTHRAVDRRAGLPEGSCSAYLRTRQALQGALTEYVASALLADVDRLADRILACDVDDDGEGVRAALDLFLHWLDQRELLVARLELTMAATRDADLCAILADHRARLIGLVEGIMAATGKEHSSERAEALVASYDGVLLAALLKPAAERADFLSRSLQLLSNGLAGAPGA